MRFTEKILDVTIFFISVKIFEVENLKFLKSKKKKFFLQCKCHDSAEMNKMQL